MEQSASTAVTAGPPRHDAISEKTKRSARFHRRIRALTPAIFIGPGIALIVFVMIYPVFYGIWQSVTATDLFTGGTTFVGFDQYAKLFASEEFLNALRQTFILVAGTVVGGIVVAVSFALVLDNLPRGGTLWRTVVLIPWLISGIAVATIWRALFSPIGGFADTVMLTLGLDPIVWFASEFWSMVVIVLVNIWSISPFATLIVYAGLKTVNLDLYEAASVDGAGRVTKFTQITVPSIGPQLSLALVFLSFAAFNSFDIVLMATGGGPGRATEVLALLLYRIGFDRLDFHGAAACMVVLLAINLALSAFYLKILPKND